ncbi:uncharacterized protein LOC141593147 [Silene latifolia]|uniref:uncharacterized protein LOC141593147 n=1 Tax=Silene latifolia TaxID=37657 RepID=UPI003D772DD1
MVKKSKESSKKPEENPNIFNKLFGEIPEKQSESSPISSLFSSENPFRRIHEQSPQIPPNPNPKKTINEQKSSEKSNKLKNPNRGNENIVQLDEKLKNPNLGNANVTQLDEKLKNPNLGNANVVQLDEKSKKKKRKRDDLEKQYEAKKYGVVVDDDDGKKVEKEKVKVGKKRKTCDDSSELMVVSKEDGDEEEGYDDEGKLLRTVFVGNLPLKVKKKILIKEFSQFGEIVSVRIRSVPTLDSKKPKKAMIFNGKLNEAADSVHAYIVFKTEQDAEASLAHNMSVVGGNHIRVDRACPPRKKLKGETASTPLYSSKRTVFLGNLPFDVKDEELYQLFSGIKELESSIEAVRVIRDRHTSLGKGIAYVLFKTREAANIVCKKRKLKIRDRELRISHAKSETQSTPSKSKDSTESTPSKRKGDFAADTENTPAKKFSSGGKSRSGRYKLNTNGDTSYQGFRASKSNDKNRTPNRSATLVPFKAGIKKGEKVKQRSEKRPSVAARKAKTFATDIKGGSGYKQAGNKRKMDARTPPSRGSNQNKKFKKSK